MSEGSGMNDFAEKNPDKFYDVAIAEQHSMTFAAGLAKEGKKPILAIYSTFLQRAYDQLIHDVALQKLDVTLAIDRAGFVGGDGATHAGIFDVSYLRCIPNMVVCTPADENETRLMLSTGFNYKGPASIRYPRGVGPNVKVDKKLDTVEIGKARLINEAGRDKVILNFGSLLHIAREISEKFKFTLIDMRFVKPLDEQILNQYLKKADLFISIEDGSIMGGAGSAVQEFCSKNNINIESELFGIPDEFIEHASRAEMLNDAGLSVDKISSRLKELI